MLTERVLRSGLRRYWRFDDVSIAVHNGGMGSATWFLGHDSGQWVAKAVAAEEGSQFAGGLRLAQQLERAGIPAGAPLPTTTGQLAVRLADCWLAVLAWVPGHPLTGHSPAERRLIGMTLAQVHRALAGGDTAAAQRFHWVDPDAAYLSLRPWLRPAITGALAVLDAADPAAMSWGLLHADPAPEAFRLDPATGRCGVIDWSYLLHGPLLYDLASAVMYVGGPAHAGDLIEAYLKQGLLDRGEVDQGLTAMLRFRWAVQANYFAWRIAENDLTGISGPGENEKGLEDARRSLTFLSVARFHSSRSVHGCQLGLFARVADCHVVPRRPELSIAAVSKSVGKIKRWRVARPLHPCGASHCRRGSPPGGQRGGNDAPYTACQADMDVRLVCRLLAAQLLWWHKRRPYSGIAMAGCGWRWARLCGMYLQMGSLIWFSKGRRLGGVLVTQIIGNGPPIQWTQQGSSHDGHQRTSHQLQRRPAEERRC